MSDPCPEIDVQPTGCPRCGVPGPLVGVAPVRSHRPDATDDAWLFCANPDCSVVYYLGEDTVGDDEVVTQVRDKAATKPSPVCFCFGHTAFSLAADLAANSGVSTATAAVKASLAEGSCACEHLNPTGRCCLGDMVVTLKTIRSTILLDTWPA